MRLRGASPTKTGGQQALRTATKAACRLSVAKLTELRASASSARLVSLGFPRTLRTFCGHRKVFARRMGWAEALRHKLHPQASAVPARGLMHMVLAAGETAPLIGPAERGRIPSAGVGALAAGGTPLRPRNGQVSWSTAFTKPTTAGPEHRGRRAERPPSPVQAPAERRTNFSQFGC